MTASRVATLSLATVCAGSCSSPSMPPAAAPAAPSSPLATCAEVERRERLRDEDLDARACAPIQPGPEFPCTGLVERRLPRRRVGALCGSARRALCLRGAIRKGEDHRAELHVSLGEPSPGLDLGCTLEVEDAAGSALGAVTLRVIPDADGGGVEVTLRGAGTPAWCAAASAALDALADAAPAPGRLSDCRPASR